eukprot:228417_1
MAQLQTEETKVNNERTRTLHFDKYHLIKSEKADCLMGYDDADFMNRAEIGCKGRHAMTAETMYNYIVAVLEKNPQCVTICCPICKTSLDWNTCTNIADMTLYEYKKWTKVIEERMKSISKRCPSCKTICVKGIGASGFRMQCKACQGPDWCWNCVGWWRGDGQIICSNSNCQFIKRMNKILRNAVMFDVPYLKNVKAPSIRACPNCLALIEFHQQNKSCKKMKCSNTACRIYFCFICLGIKQNDKWLCGSHTDPCPLAETQVFK